MSLVKATAPETVTVTLSGEEFKVGYLTMKAAAKLQAIIDKLPHPQHAAARDLAIGLAPEVQKQLVEDGRRQDMGWPPQLLVDPPAATFALLSSVNGQEELAFQILHQARPDLKDSKLRDIVAECDTEQFRQLYAAALGIRDLPDQVVTPKARRMILISETNLVDYVQSLLARLGIDLVPDTISAIVASSAPAAYGTVLNIVEGPEVPKGEIPPATNGAASADRDQPSTSSGSTSSF